MGHIIIHTNTKSNCKGNFPRDKVHYLHEEEKPTTRSYIQDFNHVLQQAMILERIEVHREKCEDRDKNIYNISYKDFYALTVLQYKFKIDHN